MNEVPCESYVPDGQFEEERIMDERAAKPRTLDPSALRAPIRTLALPPPATLAAGNPVSAAVAAMKRGNFGAIVIVDAGHVVQGIFTERDLISKIAGRGLNWSEILVGDFMTPDPETLDLDSNIAFAMNLMTIGGYRHVPIVDAFNRAVSILSVKDLMRYICSYFEKEVTNLPPRSHLLRPRKREDG